MWPVHALNRFGEIHRIIVTYWWADLQPCLEWKWLKTTHSTVLQPVSQSVAHLPPAHCTIKAEALVCCKRTCAETVTLHRHTVGNCMSVTRSKSLLEYVLLVQRGWKGLFLLCLLIPSPKCIISRIECTDDLLTVFGILKAPDPICQKLFGFESALILFCLQKS